MRNTFIIVFLISFLFSCSNNNICIGTAKDTNTACTETGGRSDSNSPSTISPIVGRFAPHFGGTAQTSGEDVFDHVLVGADGSSYFFGRTQGSMYDTNAGGGSEFDITIIKRNPDGTEAWSQQVGSSMISSYNTANSTSFSSAGSEFGSGAVFNSSGNIVISACTNGSLGGTNAGGFDIILLTISPSGNLLSLDQFGTEKELASGYDFSANDCAGTATDFWDLIEIEIDSNDNYLLTSHTRSPMKEAVNGDDMYVMKLNSSFDITWLTQFSATTMTAVNGAYVSTASDYSASAKFLSDGDVMHIGYGTSSFAQPAAGNHDIYYSRLDGATGAIEYVRQIGGVNWDIPIDAVIDDNDNLIVIGDTFTDNIFGGTGSSTSNWNTFLLKVNTTSGSVLWSQLFDAAAGVGAGYDFTNREKMGSVTIGHDGNIYSAGWTISDVADTSTGTNDIFIGKYDPSDGSIIDIHHFGTTNPLVDGVTPSGNNKPFEISIDSAGNIYMTGETRGTLTGTMNDGSRDPWILGIHSSSIF